MATSCEEPAFLPTTSEGDRRAPLRAQPPARDTLRRRARPEQLPIRLLAIPNWRSFIWAARSTFPAIPSLTTRVSQEPCCFSYSRSTTIVTSRRTTPSPQRSWACMDLGTPRTSIRNGRCSKLLEQLGPAGHTITAPAKTSEPEGVIPKNIWKAIVRRMRKKGGAKKDGGGQDAALARGHGAASSTTSAQNHDDASGLF